MLFTYELIFSFRVPVENRLNVGGMFRLLFNTHMGLRLVNIKLPKFVTKLLSASSMGASGRVQLVFRFLLVKKMGNF